MSKNILVEGYRVSPCGIVTSPRGKSLKPWKDTKGKYLYVNMGKKVRTSVHRLVASVYLKNPEELPEVNHKDCNTTNNKVTNLEWVNRSGNMQHSAKLGRVVGFYGKQKLVESVETDKAIMDEYRKKGSVKAMEGFMGCTRTTIGRYIKKRGLVKDHKVNQYG